MIVETPLKPQQEAAGARFGHWFQCLLPERFSSFESEYRAAREAVALLDTNHRAWFRLSGPDRVRYLNAMLTNETKSLASGQGGRALLLNPQGHILSELEVLSLEEEYLLSCPMPARQRTFETLDKYIIMDDVTLADVTDATGCINLEGPRAATLLADLTAADLATMAAFAHVSGRPGGLDCRIVAASETGLPGARLVCSRSHLSALWELLRQKVRGTGGLPVGWQALDSLRLEAGIPWLGYDFGEKTIPHEAALETTHISFTKGCYTGQEIVERVRSRGHVNRRRSGLAFQGPAIPAPGTVLQADGKEAGQVTSAAFSPRLGRPIGMGYLRRDFLAIGTRLEWSGGAAEVIELPLIGAAERANV